MCVIINITMMMSCMHVALYSTALLIVVGLPSPGITPLISRHFWEFLELSHGRTPNLTHVWVSRLFCVALTGGETAGATSGPGVLRRPAEATTSAAVPVHGLNEFGDFYWLVYSV